VIYEANEAHQEFSSSFLGVKFKNVKIIRSKPQFYLPFLHKTCFDTFFNLEELHLPQNGIVEIRSDAFLSNTKLRKIDLSENRLGVIGVGTFFYLKHLTFLNLKNNMNFDWKATNRSKVQNVINMLDDNFAIFHDAIYCEYSNSILKYIGRSYLCYGKSFKNYQNHRPFFDELTYIKFAFGELSELNITNDDVCALKIENYVVRYFPHQLSVAFKNLKSITFIKSEVQFIINESFSNFTDLTVLDVSFNLIETISEKFFENNKKLIYLNLQHNRIQTISSDAFKNNPLLEYVNLFQNQCVNYLMLHTNEIVELVELITKKCQRETE
jgi:Leucine-rich repeat (LRR) protein